MVRCLVGGTSCHERVALKHHEHASRIRQDRFRSTVRDFGRPEVLREATLSVGSHHGAFMASDAGDDAILPTY